MCTIAYMLGNSGTFYLLRDSSSDIVLSRHRGPHNHHNYYHTQFYVICEHKIYYFFITKSFYSVFIVFYKSFQAAITSTRGGYTNVL